MIHTSFFWKNHFENNLTRLRVDWNVKPSLTEEEKQNILYSLKAWQLGETSDGRHLLAAATKYSEKIKDAVYPEPVKLNV